MERRGLSRLSSCWRSRSFSVCRRSCSSSIIRPRNVAAVCSYSKDSSYNVIVPPDCPAILLVQPAEADGQNTSWRSGPGSPRIPPGPPAQNRGRRGTAPPCTGRSAAPVRSKSSPSSRLTPFLLFFQKTVDKAAPYCYNKLRCERGSFLCWCSSAGRAADL